MSIDGRKYENDEYLYLTTFEGGKSHWLPEANFTDHKKNGKVVCAVFRDFEKKYGISIDALSLLISNNQAKSKKKLILKDHIKNENLLNELDLAFHKKTGVL